MQVGGRLFGEERVWNRTTTGNNDVTSKLPKLMMQHRNSVKDATRKQRRVATTTVVRLPKVKLIEVAGPNRQSTLLSLRNADASFEADYRANVDK